MKKQISVGLFLLVVADDLGTVWSQTTLITPQSSGIIRFDGIHLLVFPPQT